MILLTTKKIVLEKLLKSVCSNDYGAIALFLGVVRNRSENPRGKIEKVISLQYSSYEKMAEKKMRQIQQEILKKWKGKGMGKVAMVHRLGKLKLGEISVAIAVSAVHREEAFLACRYAIESLKKKSSNF